MSRSYKKPVLKQQNTKGVKKSFNRKVRRKINNENFELDNGNYKKLNCRYDICDWNFGILSKDNEWYEKERRK